MRIAKCKKNKTKNCNYRYQNSLYLSFTYRLYQSSYPTGHYRTEGVLMVSNIAVLMAT